MNITGMPLRRMSAQRAIRPCIGSALRSCVAISLSRFVSPQSRHESNRCIRSQERYSADVPVTSHDVARVAGLSQSTVSRALRGDPRVTAQTRERVLAAAAGLGYTPNAMGRMLVEGATRTIGMVVTDLSNPFYPNLIAPLHDELAVLGYRMTLFTERLEGDEADTVGRLEWLVGRGVDGVVLTTSTLEGTVPLELLRRGLPFVFLIRVVDAIPADSVSVDNALGASLIGAEVLRFGHRHIGAILGPADASTGRDRERGFRAALTTA